MDAALLWFTIVALVLTGLLLRTRPHERTVYLNTLWLLLIGVAGEMLSAALAAAQMETLLRIVATIALIRLAGFTFFRLVLPGVGRNPPRIIEDLAIVGVYVV